MGFKIINLFVHQIKSFLKRTFFYFFAYEAFVVKDFLNDLWSFGIHKKFKGD
jgi:hypothetical protein